MTTNPFVIASKAAKARGERGLAKRIEIEGKIVLEIVRKAVGMGFAVCVNDGEEDVLVMSQKRVEIMAHCFTTDEDTLRIISPTTGKQIGYVYLVYGNDGHDVISDHSASKYFNDWMEPINDYAKQFED